MGQNHEGPISSPETITSKVQNRVLGSRMPTEEELGYKSESGFYGMKLAKDATGQIYFDFKGAMPIIDRKGDTLLRTVDDHVMRDPIAMIRRHPKFFFTQLFRGPKRHRGTVDEILSTVQRLGLTDQYQPHRDKNNNIDGITMVNNFMTTGRTLRNLYRAQDGTLPGAEELLRVDRFEALATATRYIHELHETPGIDGIGEVNADDIIFRELQDNTLKAPVFSLPDIVYNEKAKTGVPEKKAVDLLDFIMDIAREESRIPNGSIEQAVQTIVSNYGDVAIIQLVESLVNRGRFTLAGDTLTSEENNGNKANLHLSDTIATRMRTKLAIHNQARTGIQPADALRIKEIIMKACDRFETEFLNQ